MDSFTHALIGSAFAVYSGQGELLPFLVLGSVIPDIDFLLLFRKKRSPRFYLFTHGGFTHSLAGGMLTGIVAYLILVLLASMVPEIASPGGIIGLVPLLAVITGTIMHVGVDLLASPGVPLLYPLSDRKYSLHIFAGPSIFMFVVSLAFTVLLLSGMAGIGDIGLYMVIFFAILGLRIALKVSVALRCKGRILPTPHLLRWVVVTDRGTTFEVRHFQVLLGASPAAIFPKYLDTTPEEVASYLDRPEVRQHRFSSYLSVARKDGRTITFHDPLREGHYFWYPPLYQSVTLDI